MKLATVFLVVILAALPTLAATPKQLFNGNNLDGWQWTGTGEQGFVVHDGVLESADGKGILWYTREKIGNALLHVVYKMSNEKGNSGVFIRIPIQPKSENDAINKGIEVQIDNRDDDWHSTGVLYSMTKALARPYKAPGEWNSLDITLDGPRTIVKVNNVLVTDYDGVSPVPPKVKSYEPDRGPRPESGYIALQHHDQSAVILFQQVSVQPLKK
ncbi:MAG: DUF1080 domain-containing protein [Bryobacteraceae bacterium]